MNGTNLWRRAAGMMLAVAMALVILPEGVFAEEANAEPTPTATLTATAEPEQTPTATPENTATVEPEQTPSSTPSSAPAEATAEPTPESTQDPAASPSEQPTQTPEVAAQVAETQSYNAVPTEETYTINFNLNGGSGTVPASISAECNSTVTLPVYDGTKTNKTFVGWSKDKDATGASASHYTQVVYPAGGDYTIKTANNKTITLYAVWADTSLPARFFIRLDGQIPVEPMNHSSGDYTGVIAKDSAIQIGAFYTDSSTTTGVNVKLEESKLPTSEEIAKVCKAKNVSYDPETQYVRWYVIKHEGDGWHVDGVLLNKAKLSVTYDANLPAGVAPGTVTMPNGQQYYKLNVATVSSIQPTCQGYTFTGWKVEDVASVTDPRETKPSEIIYQANDTFTVYDNVKLVAQWITNVTITANTAERVYNGQPLTDSGYKISCANSNILTVSGLTVSGNVTDAGSVSNVIAADAGGVKLYQNGSDVTSQYNVILQNGTLTVKPRPITIETGSDTKVYDGTPLTKPGYTVTGDFPAGEGFTAAGIIVSASRKNAGTQENTAVYTLNENTKAGNYNITEKFGTLTVTKAPLTITGATGTFSYDGETHTVSGASYSGKMPQDMRLNVSGASISRIEAGTSAMNLKNATYLAYMEQNGTRVTGETENGQLISWIDNFTLTIVDGSITIRAVEAGPVATPSAVPTTAPATRRPGTTPIRVPGTVGTTPTATPGSTTISDDETPLTEGSLEENIADDEVPLEAGTAQGTAQSAWALVNLILMLLTALGSLLLVIFYFTKKKDRKKQGNEQEAVSENTEKQEKSVKRHGMLRIASVLVAIVSFVAFVLTEDMRLPMILIDKWTLLMAILALVQLMVMLLSKKKYGKHEADKDELRPNAG